MPSWLRLKTYWDTAVCGYACSSDNNGLFRRCYNVGYVLQLFILLFNLDNRHDEGWAPMESMLSPVLCRNPRLDPAMNNKLGGLAVCGSNISMVLRGRVCYPAPWLAKRRRVPNLCRYIVCWRRNIWIPTLTRIISPHDQKTSYVVCTVQVTALYVFTG